MLSKYDLFVKKLSSWSGGVGVAMLLLIPVITTLDILGSKLFNKPLTGSVEITGLLQVVLLPAAAAMTLLAGQHIKVEIFTEGFPEKGKRVVDGIVSLFLCVFSAVLVWQIIVYGLFNIQSGEYSSTLNWPLYPFIFIMALAFVPLCLAFLQEFIYMFKGGQK